MVIHKFHLNDFTTYSTTITEIKISELNQTKMTKSGGLQLLHALNIASRNTEFQSSDSDSDVDAS